MTDPLPEAIVQQHADYTSKIVVAVATALNEVVVTNPPPIRDTNFLSSAAFNALSIVMFDLGRVLNIPVTFIAQQMHRQAEQYEELVRSGKIPDLDPSSDTQEKAMAGPRKEPVIDF